MTLTMTDTSVLALRGELDRAAADSLRTRLAEACEDFDGDKLTLDLSAVTFIDSTGLGVLVGAARVLRAADRDLRLAACRPSMRRVPAIAGLDEFLALTDAPHEVSVA
jgi:anti-sigma B factor antagonist